MQKATRILNKLSSASVNVFDSKILSLATVIHAEEKPGLASVDISIEIPEELKNRNGYLSKGAIATMIDMYTTVAIGLQDERRSVSVDLSINYIREVNPSSALLIRAEAHAPGRDKSLISSNASIYVEDMIVARGLHTKYLLIS